MNIPRSLIWAVLFLCAVLALAAFQPKQVVAPPAFAQEKPPETKVAPGQIIVKLKSGAAANTLRSIPAFQSRSLSKKVQTLGISHARKIFPEETAFRGQPSADLATLYQLSFSENQNPVEVAAVFASDPNVEYAEPRYLRKLHFTPNDSLYALQNHLDMIKTPLAWDLQQGDSTVVIGIVDSGVDWEHPDLTANIWRNPREIPDNGIDDDGNGYVDDIRGWDFGDQDNDPKNRNPASAASHGTLVAGIAGAVTDNSAGIAGVGFNCKIMPVKAISDQQADQQFLLFGFEGIKYAAENGADIINVSWGGPVRSKFEEDIVQFAEAMGSLIVASAGNENTSSPNYPAAYPQALSVASIDSDRQKTTFSSFGSWIKVAAPGISILSTERSAGFAFATGTSFSSPMVSGVAGLVKSHNPTWSPEQVREQVRLSADNVDAVNFRFKNQLGNGLLNAFSAITKSSPAVRIDQVIIDDSNENGN
ncbi:S8 family serine peptidase, partial [bacterium]|nr:S8 family serine peptidase [bacterium]